MVRARESLEDFYFPHFFKEDRERGHEYFEEGRVVLHADGPKLIEAQVRGTWSYDVRIELDLHVEWPSWSCECPRFDETYACKHLWATILACDALRRERRISSSGGAALARAPLRAPRSPLRSEGSEAPWLAADPARWEGAAGELASYLSALPSRPSATPGVDSGQLWFALRLPESFFFDRVNFETFRRAPLTNGRLGKPESHQVPPSKYGEVSDPLDREALRALLPLDLHGEPYPGWGRIGLSGLPDRNALEALRLVAATGRMTWLEDGDARLRVRRRLELDEGEPWQLVLRVTQAGGRRAAATRGQKRRSAGGRLELVPWLARGGEERELPLWEGGPLAVFSDGFLFVEGSLSRLRRVDAAWIAWLGDQGRERLQFAAENLEAVLHGLTRMQHVPAIVPGEGVAFEWEQGAPSGTVTIEPEEGTDWLGVEVGFRYEGQRVEADGGRCVWSSERSVLLTRDPERERELLELLTELPLAQEGSRLRLDSGDLPQFVRQLAKSDWELRAQGRVLRRPSSYSSLVSTGVDWFDLEAELDFDGELIGLPAVLDAVRQQQDFVLLGDGTQGLLPEEWLKRFSRLAGLGKTEGEALRFSRSQALLLDALLEEDESLAKDREYSQLVKKLESSEGVKAAKEPRAFQGELREYQREGLGWLQFLRKLELGGCLADDMGLGKTIQVIALLQAERTRRRKPGEERRPSIAVVPKSLVFNWLEEIDRFAPRLRAIDYTGSGRQALLEEGGFDLVVTTYGTLRRDIADLREREFHYAILDEAQAIKNANSQTSKACRLIKSRHRLALSGTPIENHLGELWALFEFLNPGLLGGSTAYRRLISSKSDRSADEETLGVLRKALAPYMLRRTKEEVLSELPEKSEQVLQVEMTKAQARAYNEVRDHYRHSLTPEAKAKGCARMKMHILEALLRLRQLACDPRLLDAKKAAGAKVELLLEQLEGALRDGHKALVFSQFTTLLSIVKKELDERGIVYEYLDGKTRRRADRVKRFQKDPDCQLFLLSLKAGGHGLNLTAADYVFILDPWWNPAVEAQAVDRAHRMGQERPVMAYRLIAKDTVEEKIAELQKSKRELAEAIVGSDASLLSGMSVEDLTLLLS